MFALLLVHSLSAKALPTPASVSNITLPTSSCNDIDNCRTLWNIIWSCLSTIFLCTWVAIHPNIPEPVEYKRMSFTQRCKHALRTFFERVFMFIIALLAPEYILGWAIRQRVLVGTIAKDYGKHGLTRTHGFFIVMGGFHYFKHLDKPGDANSSGSSDEQEKLIIRDDFDEWENCYPLHRKDVLKLIDEGELRPHTIPTEAEIRDKGKSDWLAKGLVLTQTGWFVVQCIARAAQRLPVTELELVALAYTVINLGIYIAWWDKPHNVGQPVRVFQEPPAPNKVSDDTADWGDKLVAILNQISGLQDDDFDLHTVKKVPTFYSGEPDEEHVGVSIIITLVMGTIFGAIHCIAWSFDFPSHVELLLWRISAAAIAAVPAAFFIWIFLGAQFSELDDNVNSLIVKGIIFFLALSLSFLAVFYIVARAISLVLAFMALRSLPADAFTAIHWTTFIPHL